MGRYRAIMTDTDRDYIAGGEEVDSHRRYQAISRVRSRINEELKTDVEVLEEHHPELLEELREIVCEGAPEEDIATSDSSEPPVDPVALDGRTDTEAKEEVHGELAERVEPEKNEGAEEDDLRAQMEKKLDEIHIKGRPEAVKRTRREAAIYAWERLREEGEMKPSRLADDTLGRFFDDPDLNYSTASGQHPGYQLLDNYLRETVRQLPGVHPRHQTWEFREPEGEADER